MQEIQGPFHQYVLTRTYKMIASHCKEKAIKGYIIDVQISHVWIYHEGRVHTFCLKRKSSFLCPTLTSYLSSIILGPESGVKHPLDWDLFFKPRNNSVVKILIPIPRPKDSSPAGTQ